MYLVWTCYFWNFIVHSHIVSNKTAESQMIISLFGMKLRDAENAEF